VAVLGGVVMKAWKMWAIISEYRAIGALLEYGPYLTSLTGIQYAERLAESIERRLQAFIDDVS
jgi:hypothetical protein